MQEDVNGETQETEILGVIEGEINLQVKHLAGLVHLKESRQVAARTAANPDEEVVTIEIQAHPRESEVTVGPREEVDIGEEREVLIGEVGVVNE